MCGRFTFLCLRQSASRTALSDWCACATRVVVVFSLMRATQANVANCSIIILVSRRLSPTPFVVGAVLSSAPSDALRLIVVAWRSELGYLRDLVFLFKQLMVPTSDALPKVCAASSSRCVASLRSRRRRSTQLARWTPADATLVRVCFGAVSFL